MTQVAPPSKSVTDRLIDKIQSYKFDFQKKQLGILDYKMLMHDPDIEMDEHAQDLVRQYYKMASSIGNYNLDISDEDNAYLQALKDFKAELAKFGDDQYVADVLINQLFNIRKATHKAIFWDCYGDTVYENLLANKAGERKMCQRCGERFSPLHKQQLLCSKCAKQTTYVPEPPKKAICFDCGKEFVPTDLSQTRCQVCQWMYDNPVETNNYRTCVACGAYFDVAQKRGRKATMCRRCQDITRKAKKAKWIRNYRAMN